MTDRELAEALEAAARIRDQAREHWAANQRIESEVVPSLEAMRQATALLRALERWSAARTIAAATATGTHLDGLAAGSNQR